MMAEAEARQTKNRSLGKAVRQSVAAERNCSGIGDRHKIGIRTIAENGTPKTCGFLPYTPLAGIPKDAKSHPSYSGAGLRT